MNEDHWTVCTESEPYNIPPSATYPDGFDVTGTEFNGPFPTSHEAVWWAQEKRLAAFEIRFQDMSAYRENSND